MPKPDEVRNFDAAMRHVAVGIERAHDMMEQYLGKGWDASDLARYADASVKVATGLLLIRSYLEPPDAP